jgi:FRG domain
MAWHVLDVNDWDHLEQLLHVSAGRGLLYRGHADAEWPLIDSLTRDLGPGVSITTALQIEKAAQKKFIEQAHFFLDPHVLPRASSIESWWPLMQHFGAPTRLLDWTASPYVAAYFAVVDRWEVPGAIYAFSESDLRMAALEIYGSCATTHPDRSTTVFEHEDSPEFLLPTEQGEYPNIRMITQQGRFTLPGRILSNHGTLIGKLLDGKSSVRNTVFKIKPEAKPAILRKLMQFNLSSNTLFPGLDGLGRSIREYVRLTGHSSN